MSSAERTPTHGAGGCGGRKRKEPIGGAAYGTPRNATTLPSASPSTTPCLVTTTIGRCRAAGAAVRDAIINVITATTPTTNDRSMFDLKTDMCP
jgi:hypothetical protein